MSLSKSKSDPTPLDPWPRWVLIDHGDSYTYYINLDPRGHDPFSYSYKKIWVNRKAFSVYDFYGDTHYFKTIDKAKAWIENQHQLEILKRL